MAVKLFNIGRKDVSKGILSGVMLVSLLIGLLTLVFNIEPAKAGPTYSWIDNPDPSTVNSTLIWAVSPTDFGILHVLPGQSVDLVVTISNDPSSDATWDWLEMGCGGWYSEYGDMDWAWEIGLPEIPTIEPGGSWTGTIVRFTVFPTVSSGTNVTGEGCSLTIVAISPAQPECYSIPVTIIAGSPLPPVANFTWSPFIPKVGESVIFDGSSSTPNGGTITKYDWDFGDGENRPGQILTHAYSSQGTYNVTLNVTDSEGLWDTEQKQILVVQPYGPEAEFTAFRPCSSLPEYVEFNASISSPGWNGTHEMPITEYCWDFGDGDKTTTSTPIVCHNFSSLGTSYVILTVYALGATPDTDSIAHKVAVSLIAVGGYIFPIETYTTGTPLMPYLVVVAILTVASTTIKRKTRRRTKRS